MADPIWQKKLQKLLDWGDIWYPRVFGVADYESKRIFQKFEMADPNGGLKYKSYLIGMIFGTWEFQGR